MTYKANQIIQVLLKFVLPILSVLYISYEIWNSFGEIRGELSYFQKYNLALLVSFIFINLLISSLNWLIDSLKWHQVLQPKIRLSFKTAFFQNLSSHSIAVLTPNRLGDYVTKALFFDASQRKYCIATNSIAQVSQLISTTLFGVMGLIYFAGFTQQHIKFDYSILIVGSFSFVVLGFAIFSSKLKSMRILLKTHTGKFPKQIGLSILKHLIFSHQLVGILLFFGSDLNYIDCVMAVNIFYILSSVVPSIFIVDLAVKGGIGLLIFGYLEQTTGLVLMAITLMWLFNFAIPALVGSTFSKKLKLKIKDL